MKMSKGRALLAGCVALAMSHAALAADIKIAIVGAVTGPVAQYGDMQFTGAAQAIKDINAKGGVNGNKLVGVEYDDACDPKPAWRMRKRWRNGCESGWRRKPFWSTPASVLA